MRAAAHALRTLPRALPRPSLAMSPRARLRLAGVFAVALALVCLYLLWFRDSGLVRVEKVTVTGLSVDDAPRIRAALTEAARDMTTLHVREDELRQAVSGYPVVNDLRVAADFPHGLRIEVVERRPVAVLVSGSLREPVAADGTVLHGVEAPAALPPVRLGGGIPRHRLGDSEARRAVTVIAAAPDPLAALIEQVREEGAKGLVVDLADGPQVILGDSGRLEAKWIAATRVLADPTADGATYIDVRLPERPVAGGLAPEPAAVGEGAMGGASSAGPVTGGAPAAGAPQQPITPPPEAAAPPEPAPPAGGGPAAPGTGAPQPGVTP
jgi:cell division protein FtsQ